MYLQIFFFVEILRMVSFTEYEDSTNSAHLVKAAINDCTDAVVGDNQKKLTLFGKVASCSNGSIALVDVSGYLHTIDDISYLLD